MYYNNYVASYMYPVNYNTNAFYGYVYVYAFKEASWVSLFIYTTKSIYFEHISHIFLFVTDANRLQCFLFQLLQNDIFVCLIRTTLGNSNQSKHVHLTYKPHLITENTI